MNVVPFPPTSLARDRRDGAYAIQQLLDHAEILASDLDLTELSYLIGVASVAANDIVEGSATGSGHVRMPLKG